jgi:hypothetical protein
MQVPRCTWKATGHQGDAPPLAMFRQLGRDVVNGGAAMRRAEEQQARARRFIAREFARIIQPAEMLVQLIVLAGSFLLHDDMRTDDASGLAV